MSVMPREDEGTQVASAPLRLGIMGGTFDPIHLGHLLLAEQVREALALDQVLFIPTGNPHFKQDQRVTPAEHRLAMVRAAIADNPAFRASDLEIRRPGITYTRDTLLELARAYPQGTRLFFIMGSDSLATLHHWKYADELATLATYVGVNRPGDVQADEAVLGHLAGQGFVVELVTAPALEVSSTEVRSRLAAGQSVRYLVPKDVIDYARHHELY